MNLGEIQFPWKLLDSLENDALVVFVGAGASAAPPSSLPLFDGLAREIAGDSVEPEENEPLERYLGRVEQTTGILVHQRAATILSRPNSKPNELHRLIIDLFKQPDKVRVVTTNFDTHLESAMRISFEETSRDCEIFKAPALPTGSNFHGIVYLHGSLRPDPSRMVLTDRDFGRAYLTEGWARRFLKELFQSYDVLFVGYSHSDQILSYLARGLPPDTKRIRAALTEEGDTDRWKFLGIEPLEYSTGNHSEAKEALEQWHRLRSLAAMDHEAEISEIIARLALIVRNKAHRHTLSYPIFFFCNSPRTCSMTSVSKVRAYTASTHNLSAPSASTSANWPCKSS